MIKMNLKAVVSGFAALALTMVLSWTFVDATSITHLYNNDGSSAFLTSISALVR